MSKRMSFLSHSLLERDFSLSSSSSYEVWDSFESGRDRVCRGPETPGWWGFHRSSSSVFDSGEWRFIQPRAAGFGGSPLFSVGCDTTGGEKRKWRWGRQSLEEAMVLKGYAFYTHDHDMIRCVSERWSWWNPIPLIQLLEVGFIGKWWRIEFLRFGSGIDAWMIR